MPCGERRAACSVCARRALSHRRRGRGNTAVVADDGGRHSRRGGRGGGRSGSAGARRRDRRRRGRDGFGRGRRAAEDVGLCTLVRSASVRRRRGRCDTAPAPAGGCRQSAPGARWRQPPARPGGRLCSSPARRATRTSAARATAARRWQGAAHCARAPRSAGRTLGHSRRVRKITTRKAGASRENATGAGREAPTIVAEGTSRQINPVFTGSRRRDTPVR
jgi:hypothetical protein